MADNIIKVNVTSNKQQRVTVSSAQVGTEITASSDTGKFWAQNSKNWAVSENIVDGVDYSSKHYANVSKQNAQNSQSYAEAAQDTYNAFQSQAGEAVEELQTTKTSSIDEITTAKDEAVNNINSTKTTILNDIEFVADGEKEEIRDIIDTGKDELKESIGDIKFLTTLEIGDIGIAPLGIDESKGKRRYLNGQLIIQDQYVQFTNKVKSAVALYPSLACTESEWQTTATMTVGGQVGKFVVDDNAGTIRLPKIIMPIQGLTDLSKLGEIVEAGLPNITGTINQYFTAGGGDADGSFLLKNYIKYYATSGGGNQGLSNLTFDASLSNSIYGNSNTVQPESIQYPYFIQVATGAETEDNIINEIELNNPYTLFDNKYAEAPLYNISWLYANGTFNGSNAVHPSAYQALLVEHNTDIEVGTTVNNYTKRGLSVKLSTETYTDYDFVVNTADETFRLPISIRQKFYVFENNEFPVVGNGMTLGLTNGTFNGGLTVPAQLSEMYVVQNNYGSDVSTVNTWSGNSVTGRLGITTDPTKSGLVANLDSAELDGLYLYFYVGETVQNANLINAGRIEEKLVDCITRNDCKAYITETYQNGTSWYRVWSDGWCEQGGSVESIMATPSITFLKPFKDNYFKILLTQGNNAQPALGFTNPSKTGFVWTTVNYDRPAVWEAKGYIR